MDARRTETCVAPRYVDASRNFHVIFSERAACRGGGGCAARFSLFFSSFPCSADHERDWPPCKVNFSGWPPILHEFDQQLHQQRGSTVFATKTSDVCRRTTH